MAQVINKQKKETVLELVGPDFSSITDATGEPLDVISWNLSMTSEGYDSISVIVLGIPFFVGFDLGIGETVTFPIRGQKDIRASVKSVSTSISSDGRIISTIEAVDFSYYLDTQIEQPIKVSEKKFQKIILEIYNSLGIDIQADPNNDDIDWVMNEFRCRTDQSILSYINSSLTQGGQAKYKWWIDIFGVFHLYKTLTPITPSFTIDISNEGYLVQNLQIIKVDNQNTKSLFKNLEIDNVDPKKSKEVDVVKETPTEQANGKYVKTEIVEKKGSIQKKINSRSGTTIKSPNVDTQVRITKTGSITLKGSHYVFPQNKIVIKNAPFGNSEEYVCVSTNISQSQNGDITTNIEVETNV